MVPFGQLNKRGLLQRGRFSAGAAVLLATLLGASRWSPTYAQEPPAAAAAPPSAAALASKVPVILRNPQAPSADELKIIDDYLGAEYLGMTKTDPDSLGLLAKKRKDLFARVINVKGSQQARDQVLTTTLRDMGRIAIRNFHPAVRYNAVLILGQLDKEMSPGGNQLPVPLPKATNALVMFLEKPDFNGVPVTSPVKVAALVGLERHSRLGIDPQLSERLAKAVLAMANDEETPADVSPDVHDWMRRLAVRVLASIDAKGLTKPTYDSIAKLISAKRVNLDDRCGIAEMLEATHFTGAKDLDMAAMTTAIGKLGRDALDFEAKEAEKYQKDFVNDPSGGGGGFSNPMPMRSGEGGGVGRPGPGGGIGRPGGGYGGVGGYGRPGGGMGPPGGSFDFGTPEEQGPHIEKRRVADRLMAIDKMAKAAASTGSDELKARMTELSNILKPVIALASDKDSADLTVADAILVAAEDMRGLVGEWAPADEPAEEAKEGDEFGAAAAAAMAADAEAADKPAAAPAEGAAAPADDAAAAADAGDEAPAPAEAPATTPAADVPAAVEPAPPAAN